MLSFKKINIIPQNNGVGFDSTLSQYHHLAPTFEVLCQYAHDHRKPLGWAVTAWVTYKAAKSDPTPEPRLRSCRQLSIELGGEE